MRRFLMFLLYASAFCGVAQATPNCPQGHCGSVSAAMNQFCISNGLAGKPYLVFAPDGSMCFCPCSCVTSDTLLDGPQAGASFAAIELGTDVFTPMAAVPQASLGLKLRSEVNDATLYALSFANGKTVTASDNHTFISADERTVMAKDLKIGDMVLGSDLQALEVTGSKQIHHFSGELFNVITNLRSTAPADHVISTNQVLSGDWLLQASSDRVATGVAIRSGEVKTYH